MGKSDYSSLCHRFFVIVLSWDPWYAFLASFLTYCITSQSNLSWIFVILLFIVKKQNKTKNLKKIKLLASEADIVEKL